MKEKELKIKQKSDFIKKRKREIFDIKEKPVNLFNNRSEEHTSELQSQR